MNNQPNTSWNKVAKWYKKVPKEASSYHQTLVIPGLTKLLKRHVGSKGNLIDVACGEGSISKAMADLGYSVTGFDTAPGLIDHAKAMIRNVDFYIEDATKLSEKFARNNIEKYDCGISTLAIQNIADLDKAVGNIRLLLKENGIFILVINHPHYRMPKYSSWGYNGKDIQYRMISRYMSSFNSAIEMNPGSKNSEVTHSFHRPLEQYVKSFLKNGLALIDLEEWVSNRKSEPGPRAEAENLARKEIPLFMCLVLKRIG